MRRRKTIGRIIKITLRISSERNKIAADYLRRNRSLLTDNGSVNHS